MSDTLSVDFSQMGFTVSNSVFCYIIPYVSFLSFIYIMWIWHIHSSYGVLSFHVVPFELYIIVLCLFCSGLSSHLILSIAYMTYAVVIIRHVLCNHTSRNTLNFILFFRFTNITLFDMSLKNKFLLMKEWKTRVCFRHETKELTFIVGNITTPLKIMLIKEFLTYSFHFSK